MRSPIAERAPSLGLVALVVLSFAPAACRDDKPRPPLENPGTGGATTGRGGSGGRASGSGGARSDAAPDLSPTVDGAGDTAAPVDGLLPDSGGGDVIVTDTAVPGDTAGPADVGSDAPSANAMRPFASAPPYPAGIIRPTGAQGTLDAAVAAFYAVWKRDYIKNGCTGSYVLSPTSEGPNTATTSEVHGAGMLAVVIMAGQDPAAKTTYDNLYKVARAYKSAGSPLLMAARVSRMGGTTGNCTAQAGVDARTEGDMHIAMSLLMADKQWGSAGAINYLDQAKMTIGAIKAKLMNPTTKLPYQGDYAAGGDMATATRVRTSDLWPGHMQAFGVATGDPFWTEAVTAAYALIGKIQAGPSMASGLLPDYIINTGTATPGPAPGNEGLYWYEAVRAPLGLALDNISNASRAKATLDKINAWIKTKAGGVPSAIRDAYQLDGNVKTGNDVGESPLFEATFGAAAIADPANQAWLDAIWARVSKDNINAESNVQTVQLLAIIAISGHWWAP